MRPGSRADTAPGDHGMQRSLYRIDDVLLRAAGATFLLALGAAALVVMAGLHAGPVDGRDPGRAALARHALPLAIAALCPVGLLGAGIALRRRERRIAAIWDLLRQNAELGVPGLIANSDFEREDLERAVRFLNNRGLGHYVWDLESDTIQDGRLRSMQMHVEKCDVCGASVSLEIPIAFREVPRCPHCHDPVSIDLLAERRRETIRALREPHSPARGPGDAGSFSFPLFLLLLFLFWPAALGYAWLKWKLEH